MLDRILERLNAPKTVLALIVVSVLLLSAAYFFRTEERSTTTSSLPTTEVLVGAGDIASCDLTGDEDTAKLLDRIPGTIFTTGDHAYYDGTETEFAECYEPSWGRHTNRTYPVPGNHDYNTANASGYFSYFGPAAGEPGEGYYSYDLGEWHIIALNSTCESVIGGCQEGSPMLRWLEEDLATNSKACTLAYWHRPLFSSGATHGNGPDIKPIWDALYAAGAEVVVNGHEHNYERFAPQDPNGVADAERGIREFVVGTGGYYPYPLGEIQPNSEVRNDDTHGVLKLTLRPSDYEWEFVPVADNPFKDSGSGSCH